MPVCEFFAGDGTFPLPSWALETPDLWTVNVQLSLSCQLSHNIDYILGVGSYSVAALTGIEARNFFQNINLRQLGFAALRFAGWAGAIGAAGSTVSEVCHWLDY